VTFWHYLPEVAQSSVDTGALARLLSQLHQLPPPPLDLPETRPFGTLAEDARRCAWLPESQRSWLLAQCEELDHWYAQATWTLGSGLIHGDAYTDNLIHTPGGVLLSDWGLSRPWATRTGSRA
jgi:aminoglycoside phosphotransferase (APT) family kinase protein